MIALLDEVLELPLEPHGAGRTGVQVLPGRRGGTGPACPFCKRTLFVKVHPRTKTERWERLVALHFGRSLPSVESLGERPLQVDILGVKRRPQNLLRRKDPDGLLWAPVTPDADNLAKSVLDAMQRCRCCGQLPKRCKCGPKGADPLLSNDGRIVALSVRKCYSERAEPKAAAEPRTRVRVRELDPDASRVHTEPRGANPLQLSLFGE